MWMMIFMSGKWYARDYGSEAALRSDMTDLFTFVGEGTVVSLCDDLETWCDEMNVEQADVVMAAEEE